MCAFVLSAPDHCKPEIKAAESEFSFLRKFASVVLLLLVESITGLTSELEVESSLVFAIEKSGSRTMIRLEQEVFILY